MTPVINQLKMIRKRFNLKGPIHVRLLTRADGLQYWRVNSISFVENIILDFENNNLVLFGFTIPEVTGSKVYPLLAINAKECYEVTQILWTSNQKTKL